MTAYGTPSEETVRLGEEIARIRTSKHLSRSKVVRRLPDDIEMNEQKLALLETGRVVKVSREEIEGLCHALQCTPRERTRLLLCADRNVFDEPSPGKELLIYCLDQLYDGASEIWEKLALDHRSVDLNKDEVFEILSTALEAVLAESRDRPSRSASTSRDV